jgi:hypothetical protein
MAGAELLCQGPSAAGIRRYTRRSAPGPDAGPRTRLWEGTTFLKRCDGL